MSGRYFTFSGAATSGVHYYQLAEELLATCYRLVTNTCYGQCSVCRLAFIDNNRPCMTSPHYLVPPSLPEAPLQPVDLPLLRHNPFSAGAPVSWQFRNLPQVMAFVHSWLSKLTVHTTKVLNEQTQLLQLLCQVWQHRSGDRNFFNNYFGAAQLKKICHLNKLTANGHMLFVSGLKNCAENKLAENWWKTCQTQMPGLLSITVNESCRLWAISFHFSNSSGSNDEAF